MLGQDFEQVLTAARTGAEWAWSLVYRDLAEPMLGYLRARGAPDAEDALGEVFLQIVRDLPTFEGDERAFRTWAFTIAHHRLLDQVRHRARRPVDPASDETLHEGVKPGNAEEEAVGSLLAGQVRRFIGRLSADQQDVLLLRLLAQLTVEEVAHALDKTQGAVKALQRRGLATLRKEMSKEGVTL